MTKRFRRAIFKKFTYSFDNILIKLFPVRFSTEEKFPGLFFMNSFPWLINIPDGITHGNKAPCYNQSYLSQHEELWFSGILKYLGNGTFNNSMFSSIQNESNSSFQNVLSDDRNLYYASNNNKTFQRDVGFHFKKITVRPSAVCIRCFFPMSGPNRSNVAFKAPRAFTVIGIDSRGTRYTIGEFSHTELKTQQDGDIFYLNTDTFFPKICIHQTSENHSGSYDLVIERMEIHGEMKKNEGDDFLFSR